jgi:hypothetical protein
MPYLKSGAVAGVGFGEAFLQNYGQMWRLPLWIMRILL